ncbi:hypothetical protein LSH36_44g07025 [Paralvinella palmiformis]|uniref:G-protein coupled receptors family 1 profile domain-containing protein n=1 Tax=Paralvinella palmiformis TaxID=53620 RepID=A0AAD9K775_9ANNE|nr:hypothetical protein LSH36_44g07025 [Paralvinella palmiformis]
MKKVKRTTVIFLSQLAISNLIQGIILLLKGLFYVWDVNTNEGCMALITINITSFGIYLTGIFYIYLDLYLSLKKMSVANPVISVRAAVILTALSWIGSVAISVSGYGMTISTYQYTQEAGCILTKGLYQKQYILFITIIFLIGLLGILTLHVITYRLMKRIKRHLLGHSDHNHTVTGEDSSGRTPHVNVPERGSASPRMIWLKKNDVVMKTILIILIFFIISWYPLLISVLIVIYCEACTFFITEYVWRFVYILVILQYNINGIIYMSKLRDFRNTCKRLCCKFVHHRRRVEPSGSETA